MSEALPQNFKNTEWDGLDTWYDVMKITAENPRERLYFVLMESIAECMWRPVLSPSRFCDIPQFGVISHVGPRGPGDGFSFKKQAHKEGEHGRYIYIVVLTESFLYQSLPLFNYGGS